MEPQLLHTVDDGVATVVMHHPAKRNAMTAAMWKSLPPLLDEFAADPHVRLLVLTGAGGTFCAGTDIAALHRTPDAGGVDGVSGAGAPSEGTEATARTAPAAPAEPGARAAAQQLASLAEDALAAFPKPTLAVVRGHCVGGGCTLAVACDLRFADENALFGVTPANLGIVLAMSSTRRLIDLLGPATAKYLLFSGELIATDRALRTGLVDEVLPADALDARVAEFTRLLTSRSQLTQAAAKEFAAGRWDREAYWAEEARASGETAEGVAAFLERRRPRFGWSHLPRG